MLIGFCGPSAVGKTTIMRGLAALHGWNFVRVATTRPVREGEKEKFQISPEDYAFMNASGAFWCSNNFFGNSYGTLQSDISQSGITQDIYMLDWPVAKVQQLSEVASIVFLIVPETEDQLIQQATACGRGDRLGEIIHDYRNHYSTNALGVLSAKSACPLVLLTNSIFGSGDSSLKARCQSILTETLQLSTK